MSLGDLLESLQSLDLEEVASAAIEETMPELIKRNRDQLYHGITSTGGRLAAYRRRKYAQAKNLMNPLPGFGNPDFYVTGAFYEAIRGEVSGGVVGIHSYDSKAPYLEDRDGADNIYGLTFDNQAEYIQEDMGPAFFRGVHERLKLAA